MQQRPVLPPSSLIHLGLCLILSLAFLGSARAATNLWQYKDDFVRLEPADGAPANPPARVLPVLSTDAVRAVLASVRVGGEHGETELLDEDQVAAIAEPVARGLKIAGPNEDVAFAVHSVSFMSIVGPPKTTAGRILYDGEAIALIIGQVQETYLRNMVTIDPAMIKTGSRRAAQQTAYHILPGGAVSLAQAGRGDWARISPVAWTGTYGMPMVGAPAAPSVGAIPPGSGTFAPVAPVSPAAVLTAPPPSDPLQIEQRFAALKSLLDRQMISQADYDQAKAELLKALSTLPPR